MTPSDKVKRHWAQQRLKNTMLQSRDAMNPYLDLMESEKGLMAMMVISCVSMSLHAGSASPAELAHAIKKSAAMSGIPEVALEAYSRFITAMIQCGEFE